MEKMTTKTNAAPLPTDGLGDASHLIRLIYNYNTDPARYGEDMASTLDTLIMAVIHREGYCPRYKRLEDRGDAMQDLRVLLLKKLPRVKTNMNNTGKTIKATGIPNGSDKSKKSDATKNLSTSTNSGITNTLTPNSSLSIFPPRIDHHDDGKDSLVDNGFIEESISCSPIKKSDITSNEVSEEQIDQTLTEMSEITSTRSFHELTAREIRFLNKKAYNLVRISLQFALKGRFRTMCRKVAREPIENEKLKQREKTGWEDSLPYVFSSPQTAEVARLLSQSYSRKDVRAMLNLTVTQLNKEIQLIKEAINS